MAYTLKDIQEAIRMKEAQEKNQSSYADNSSNQMPYQDNTEQEEMGKFSSALSGFNKPFENLTFGALSKIPGQFGQKAQAAHAQRQQEYRQAQGENPLSTFAGEILGTGVRDLPMFAAGQGIANKLPVGSQYLKNIVGAGLGGAGMGAIEGALGPYDAGEEALHQGLGAAGVSAVLPPLFNKVISPVAKYAKEGAKSAFERFNLSQMTPDQREVLLAKELMSGLSPEQSAEALRVKNLAKEFGINLTPAEASGNPVIAAREAKIPKSESNKLKIHEFKEGEKEAQKFAIEELKDTIGSPHSGDIDLDFRNASKSAIEKEKQLRAEKAAPFYEASRSDEISERAMKNLLKNDVIKHAFKTVNKIPAYRESLKDVNPYSMEYLDVIKKLLNRESAKSQTAESGFDKFEGAVIADSAAKLTRALKKASPDYKEALKTFSEESPAIKKLETTELGKIANMDDLQAKNALSTIFDNNQNNPKRILDLREAFIKENPKNKKLWDSAVREHFERQLDTANLGKMETHGTNFYNKIGNTEKRLDQIESALQHNPDAIERLQTLRTVFKNLVNARTVKGEAGRAENNMNQNRNAISNAIEIMDKIFNKQKESELVDLLTSGKWDKAFQEVDLSGTPQEMANQLSKILRPIIDIPSKAAKNTYEMVPESTRELVDTAIGKSPMDYFLIELNKKRQENSR